MRSFFLFALSLLSVAAYAQPKVVTQAVISTSTNIIAPDDDDVSQIQNQNSGGFSFRNMADGEIKSTTYIRDSMVKTNFKSETFRGTIYRDNAAKTTTTVFEIMGNKQAIRASDDEQADAMKKMDSIRREKAKTDTSIHIRPRPAMPASAVAYTGESKKIAGYDCKKAYIITDHLLGKDSLAVWYTPELSFPNVVSTGGTSGFGGGMTGMGGPNFNAINGFVMQYERSLPNGRRMEVKVTKIELTDVAAKEFELPKDIEIKTMKDMQNGGFRMFQRP